MPNNINMATKFFTKSVEGFATTLNTTISANVPTVVLNSTTGYTVGDQGVWIVDPASTSAKNTFTGTVAAANTITGVVWTEGTPVGHTAGATVVDYVTATHWDLLNTGILKHANPDGSLITSAVQNALGLSNLNGYTPVGFAPSTITYNGNHSYNMLFTGQDLTSFLSPGMRIRTSRTVACPVNSASLNGTTQYFSKTSPAGMTFTNNFVVSAWIKLSSYPAATAYIESRYDGTNGWGFNVQTSGTVQLVGFNGGAANARAITSYQSLPLNKWVHVTAELDMVNFTNTATTNYVMFDGVDVPALPSQTGTNPTSLLQGTGAYQIGAINGANFFPGKIAQAAVFGAKVTQATMQGYISQGLAGTEISLISAYSFNNTLNDLNTTNANNLTAINGAVATNADSPFGGQADGTISSTLDYAEVVSATFSTNTTVVLRATDVNTIPTIGGVASVVYSSNFLPYNFPNISTTLGEALLGTSFSTASATFVQVPGMSTTVTIPPGGRRYKVTFWCSYIDNATNSFNEVTLWDGPVNTGTQLAINSIDINAVNTRQIPSTLVARITPSSGSKTYNVGFRATAGTGTLSAASSSPAFISVEPT